MGEEEVQEASAAVQLVSGLSNYLAGMQYDLDKYREELRSIVQHVESQQRQQRAA